MLHHCTRSILPVILLFSAGIPSLRGEDWTALRTACRQAAAAAAQRATTPEALPVTVFNLAYWDALYAHALALPLAADEAERSRLRTQYDGLFARLPEVFDPVDALVRDASGAESGPAVQALALLTLSELFSRLCDHRAREYARQLFTAIDREYPRLLAEAAPTEGVALLEALSRYLRVDPQPRCRVRLAELLDRLSAPGVKLPAPAAPVLAEAARMLRRQPTGLLGQLRQIEADASGAAEAGRLLTLYDLTGEAVLREQAGRAISAVVAANPGSEAELLKLCALADPLLTRHLDAYRRYRSADHALELPKRTIHVSLAFPYNHRRSAESLVSEVKANGYDAILAIIKEPDVIPDGLVEAARAAGIPVYGHFFSAQTYTQAIRFPAESKEWEMRFTEPRRRYFSFVHDGYRQWWKEYLHELYAKHPFAGQYFFESYYTARGGRLAKDRGAFFGDISPNFARCFRQATGHSRFPDFTDPKSPDFYLSDPALYRDYVEFRVRSIIDFHREIWDGENGLRVRYPDLVYMTWSVALAGDGALEEMREFQGQDAARMVSELQPDVHFLQSHWPDWLPQEQTPAYVHDYAPYVRSIRSVYPDQAMAVQGDFCSTAIYRRSPEWVEEFHRQTESAGFTFDTFYSLAVRGEIYNDPPRVYQSSLDAAGSGRIIFDQYISAESARKLLDRPVADGLTIKEISTDGNILNFKLSESPLPGTEIRLDLTGLANDAKIRVGRKNGRGNPRPVKPGTVVKLTAPAL